MTDPVISGRMRTLYVIFGALLAGQVMFAIVATIVAQVPAQGTAELHSVMMYAAPLLILMGFVFGNFMFKLIIGPARNIPDENGKIQKYATASIVKWGAQEGPNLLTIVIFLLTAETYYLYILGGGIMLFLTSFPNLKQYESQTR